MKTYLITFRSVTYAQRGEQALTRAGIRTRLRRTPRWMEERGCGYGVETVLGTLEDGLEVLRRQQIPWRRIWAQKPGGEMEEVRHDLP